MTLWFLLVSLILIVVFWYLARKAMRLVLLVWTLLAIVAIVFTVFVYIDASRFNAGLEDGEVFFFDNATGAVFGGVHVALPVTIYEQDDFPAHIDGLLHNASSTRLLVPISLFGDKTGFPDEGSHMEQTYWYYQQLNHRIDVDGSAYVLYHYFSGRILFSPDPWTFRVLRRQPLFPVSAMVGRSVRDV